MNIQSFTFNPFQENTYVLYDETKDGILVDPGCYFPEEEDQLLHFIQQEGISIVSCVLTHAHIDHVMGCAWARRVLEVAPELHELEVENLERAAEVGKMYGIPVKSAPAIGNYLIPGQRVEFGNTELEILFTPGHSAGSVCFYHEPSLRLIGGDVLFYDSIGRTDLPGGNFETLENSILTQLYRLPDQVEVFPGHGPSTTVGREKVSNPFVRLGR